MRIIRFYHKQFQCDDICIFAIWIQKIQWDSYMMVKDKEKATNYSGMDLLYQWNYNMNICILLNIFRHQSSMKLTHPSFYNTFGTNVCDENSRSNVRYILRSMSRALWESTEMLEILNTPHEIIDNTDKELAISSGKINFEKVVFSYDSWDNIFEWLDLNIKPGEKVAIVWASWSWKTTLTKLLFRFFDIQWWKILIDWQDISQVTQDSLRSQLSMVPQDPVLFHRSLRENIAYWKPDATEQEIIAASKMAKCHDFISKLKDWYDTFVWERWIKLSWWERQRVAIARAILENKRILVMDEATSSLDSESEKFIQDAMDEVMRNKTCIVIAHRLSTIIKMDKIIVMDNWKIVESWSHNALIKNPNGIYHKLRSIQSGWFFVNDA